MTNALKNNQVNVRFINLILLTVLIVFAVGIEYATYTRENFWTEFLYVSLPDSVSLTVLILLVTNILIKAQADFQVIELEKGKDKIETKFLKLEYKNDLVVLFGGLGIVTYFSFVSYGSRLPMAKSYGGLGILLSTPYLLTNILLACYYFSMASRLKDSFKGLEELSKEKT